MIDVIN